MSDHENAVAMDTDLLRAAQSAAAIDRSVSRYKKKQLGRLEFEGPAAARRAYEAALRAGVAE